MQVPRQGGDQPRRNPAAIGPSVQREVHPRVAVPLQGTGRQVRRVRENEVEPPKPVGQVSQDDVHRQRFVPSPGSEHPEGHWIQVGRHDPPGAVSCCGEGRDAPAAPHFEHELAPAGTSDPDEEPRILADGIHFGDRSAARVGPSRCVSHRRAPNTL